MTGARRAALIGFVAILSTPAAADTDVATPQRPSISFNTSTVAARRFEIESGALLATDTATLPIFGKYGLTDRTELEVSFDAIRRVDVDGDTAASSGDLALGVRSRVAQRPDGSSYAVAGWLKIPTAGDVTGSGDPDAGFVGIMSRPMGGFSLDANLWLTALGQDGRSAVVQTQGVVTLGFPARSRWSGFVEAAWQHTATMGSGGFVDAGMSCAITPRSILDVAVGAGWSDGYPDWAATAGWTILLPHPR